MKGYIHQLESFGCADGPGSRFIIFFQGCQMRCKFCHNPDTWDITKGTEYTAEELIKEALSCKSYWNKKGGITVSGGEPLMQIDFVLELFTLAKQKGIHTCLDTSGIAYKPNGNPEWLAKMDKLCAVTDLVMLDIKHIDPKKHQELVKQPNDGILAFAEYLDKMHVDLWIRHVVVPGITDDEESLHKLGYFIGGLSNLKALDVLPYHTMGVVKYQKLGIEYPLKDVPAMETNRVPQLKQYILDGIKERRAKQAE